MAEHSTRTVKLLYFDIYIIWILFCFAVFVFCTRTISTKILLRLCFDLVQLLSRQQAFVSSAQPATAYAQQPAQATYVQPAQPAAYASAAPQRAQTYETAYHAAPAAAATQYTYTARTQVVRSVIHLIYS